MNSNPASSETVTGVRAAVMPRVRTVNLVRGAGMALVMLFSSTVLHGQSEEMLGSIKGAPAPIKVAPAGKGVTAYVYGNYTVLVAPFKDSVGENITVYKCPASPAKSGTNAWKKLTPYLKVADADQGKYFAGITGNALFVITQTGPDGVLAIYDLRTKRRVFENGFRDDTVRITKDGNVTLESLVRANVSKLTPSEAKEFPEIAKWLATGGSAGWFREIGINLTTFKTTNIGKPQLRQMQ